MKFCSQCGNPVTQRIPEGDSRLRFVCDTCHTIHYQNPNIVAGCVPTWGSKVLLCRRAIEPRRGYWTLPAGFMENGETVEQAAVRETAEEACARVRNLRQEEPRVGTEGVSTWRTEGETEHCKKKRVKEKM